MLSVLLMLLLIAIPVLILVILIRHLILKHQLKADQVDNAVLYKEIGRLNKQVLSLMDEKNRILALKSTPWAVRSVFPTWALPL